MSTSGRSDFNSSNEMGLEDSLTTNLEHDMSEVKSLQEDITAKVTEEMAKDLVKSIYGLRVKKIKQLNGYDDKNFHIKIESLHTNPYLKGITLDGYVLKIINTDDTKWPQAVDMHIHAMHCLNDNKIRAPLPVKNLKGEYFSEEEFYEQDEHGHVLKDRPKRHLVRMSTFIPGHVLYDHPHPSYELFQEVGKLVARVGTALEGIKDHEIFTLPTHGTVWLMKNHHWLKNYIYATRTRARREILTDIVEVFQEKVLANTEHLTQGIIHNDINEQNILISHKHHSSDEEQYEICGLLDFTDINASCKVFDIAITMMYMMTMGKDDDFIKIGAAVLKGYLSETTLTPDDLEVLPYAVVMRYALSLGMGEHGVFFNPENLYLLTTAQRGWDQMERLWTMPWDDVRKAWGIAKF